MTWKHGEMPRMPRPSVSDTIGIAEFIRLRGSVDYPLEAVPGDFVIWRRKIRQEAKGLRIRVSVIRSGDIVVVHNPDHEPSQDELRATMEVMGFLTSDLLGPSDRAPVNLTFDDALHAQRRARLRVVQDAADT